MPLRLPLLVRIPPLSPPNSSLSCDRLAVDGCSICDNLSARCIISISFCRRFSSKFRRIESSSFSPESSSNVLFLVSGTRSVSRNPQIMRAAKISRTWFRLVLCPLSSLKRLKRTWAMMAPSLPKAAEIPWAVVRYRVGKTSPGIINYANE
jgi:hypothetical protein